MSIDGVSPPPFGGGELVRARVEFHCSAIGLSPPPGRIHLRVSTSENGWLLYLWNQMEQARGALAWLATHVDVTSEIGDPSWERVALVRARTVPPGLERLIEDLGADLLIMDPDGTVHTCLEASTQALQAFLEGDEDAEEPVAVHASERPRSPRSRLLQLREETAVLHAFSQGYYAHPRGVSLAALARDLDTSMDALAGLLRDAESKLLAGHFENLVHAPTRRAPVRPSES